jgi:formamidopyrimidine-DNA glycosylase
LYSRSKNKEAQKIIEVWNFMKARNIQQGEFQFETMKKTKRKKTYRERMIEAFDRDPTQCPCCKHPMLLVVIWHADYGRLYYYDEERERKLEKTWGIQAYERRRKNQKRTG